MAIPRWTLIVGRKIWTQLNEFLRTTLYRGRRIEIDMDFLGSGFNTSDTATHNQNFSCDFPSSNATNLEASYVRFPCDGRFSWPIHGPLIVLCLLILAFNGIVVALMYWKESLRTRSNIILVSLAVSDLMSGLVGIPLFFACSLSITSAPPRKGPPIACVCSVLFFRFTAVSTVFHFVLSACDRYILIIRPFLYQNLLKLSRVRFALIVIWTTSPLIASIQLAWYKTENLWEVRKQDTVYFLVLLVAFLAMPLFLMLCIYAHILVLSVHHLHALRVRRNNLGGTTERRSIARDMRGNVIWISMLAVFALCWFPFFLMILQNYSRLQVMFPSPFLFCYVLFARFVPPVTNPLFCALCKRDFRNFLRVLTKSRRANDTVRTSIERSRREATSSTMLSQRRDGLAEGYERKLIDSSFGLHSVVPEHVECESSV